MLCFIIIASCFADRSYLNFSNRLNHQNRRVNYKSNQNLTLILSNISDTNDRFPSLIMTMNIMKNTEYTLANIANQNLFT